MKTRIFGHWLFDGETWQESYNSSAWRQGQMQYPEHWYYNEPT